MRCMQLWFYWIYINVFGMLYYHHAMLLLLVLNIGSRSAFTKHIERYWPGRYAWSLCCWRPTSGAAHNVVLWTRLRCVGFLTRSAIPLGSWRLSLPCYLGHPPFCQLPFTSLDFRRCGTSRPFVTLLDVPDNSRLFPTIQALYATISMVLIRFAACDIM